MKIEDEEYIVNNYHKETTKNILKKLSISKTSLLKIIKKHNIKLKSSKKYLFNEDFFKYIDNEEKAYWLGFFYADGCVRIRKISSESKLKLSIKDLEHLEKFKSAINGNNKIIISNRIASLSLNTHKFTNNLINQGCQERKTHIIQFPKNLNSNLIRHFIRGYFDGDGSISISKKQYKYKNIIKSETKNGFMLNFVSGSNDMLLSLANIISNNCKTKNRKIYKYNNNKFGYIAWWTISDITAIYKYFYDDSFIYLERKKKIFENIINLRKIKLQKIKVFNEANQ